MRTVVCFVIIVLLTGCDIKPFARELESTMLVQVLGVDWSEDVVALTAACDSGAENTGASTVLSADGRDFEEAKKNLQSAGEEYVSLTHVTQIVLGEGADLDAVLETALKEPALSQSATVWLSENGSAKDLLERVNGGAKRLSSVELNSGVKLVTVLQCRMRLEEQGQTELPMLAVENNVLTWTGTKKVSEDKREAR